MDSEKLQKKDTLSRNETTFLAKLKNDLDFMIRNKIGKVDNDKEEDLGEILGKKSVFYDPDWNEEGVAPPGCKNVRYNEATFKRRRVVTPRLCGLNDIQLP
ncbi:similar to Saccharomyces cerevisiae YBR194W AIM4 Protein proposed to be associated with the nuclear pore complex [Maudiozyma saulgeensis]|uniref:Similar to Saccharomyces cerevisiae YBR194W AIM4 Protein proposed to be associated with the nuclear pore complex n=1 Tax=Maudiozyma saulgeensis TaxID=1789683 RepID=A0A1X7R1Y6_9SACH|nr:similar to Saccharomyces cerevisiae YBR194W AIM4 Protein proposed to be associated with the nuclear pore complex [Kazachstania saulgeensis]